MFTKLLLLAGVVAGAWYWLRRRASAAASTNNPAAMTTEQARKILGLAPGCTRADVIASHRRLISAVHPDRGGSTYLAQQLNDAKRHLLAQLTDV